MKLTKYLIAAVVPFMLLASPAHAQSSESEFELNPDGSWNETAAPEPGTDAFLMAEASKLIAEGNASKASKMLSKWLDKNKRTRNPYLAQAFTLRGEARLRNNDEYNALFDFETVIRDFSSSDYFIPAVEMEYEIATLYLNGLKRKFLGMRTDDARPTGEEIMIRVQERVPGSALAEQAAIDLADHFYRRRELKLAAEMYSIFRENYPQSSRLRQVMLREIECNIARFKGPLYDGSGLVDAKLLIEEYAATYPAESERAGITEGLTSWIDESAAQQVLYTARWYMKTDDNFSAKFVLQRLINRHPVTDAAQEAIEIMLEKGWAVRRTQADEPTPATDAPEPAEGSPVTESTEDADQ
jgi:outer membrane protein assembly factor BamD (BamD/ComL family)